VLLLIARPRDFCLSRSEILFFAVVFFIFGVIGAKLFHFLFYAHLYLGQKGNFSWREMGVASMGVHLLGFFSLYLYSKRLGKPFLQIADYFIVFFPLAVFLMRIGCFLAGCCFGLPSALPWAIIFNVLNDGLSRHPTQIYEMIYALAIFVTAWHFYPRLRTLYGATFFSVYFSYFFMRFFNEFLRTDNTFIIGKLKFSHLEMLMAMVVCVFGLRRYVYKSKESSQAFLKLLPKMLVTFIFSLIIFACLFLATITYTKTLFI
jgi:phosphatidylglycerol:prolipoprotein diacylglycerol transferase